MNIQDIYISEPGSRLLVACGAKDQEDMVESVCFSMPASFKARTDLNASPIVSMDIASDENPNHFSDLMGLCSKLITGAGRRSHFEGLLLLNIAGLARAPENSVRMKALGEFLSIPDGLASRCITLLYGLEKERELLICAEHLDFDGRLKVGCYEQANRLSLAELLAKSSLRCATPDAEKLLESTLADMACYEDFNAGKFVRACETAGGQITRNSVSQRLNDPYSYINRVKKAAELRDRDPSVRRIGFQAAR